MSHVARRTTTLLVHLPHCTGRAQHSYAVAATAHATAIWHSSRRLPAGGLGLIAPLPSAAAARQLARAALVAGKASTAPASSAQSHTWCRDKGEQLATAAPPAVPFQHAAERVWPFFLHRSWRASGKFVCNALLRARRVRHHYWHRCCLQRALNNLACRGCRQAWIERR